MDKKEREQLVIRLYGDGKTMRDIASEAHMSFGDIGKIIKRLNGQSYDDDISISNKSKETQALWLFEQKKRPIDLAIALDLHYDRVAELQQEYWALKELHDLELTYMEIKNYLTPFLQLFNLLKKNRILNKQSILKLLRYANHDLPSLEYKIRTLTDDTFDMERKKIQSRDEITMLSSSILQLRKSLNQYEWEIKQKREIIANLDQLLNQKSDALQAKLSTIACKSV